MIFIGTGTGTKVETTVKEKAASALQHKSK